jgi:hypothetical protein
MTQEEQVHSHIVMNGSITSWDAIVTYRITRLSEMIRRLRELGVEIKSEWKTNTKNKKRFVEYVLVKK